jgi:hypothetical protein
VIVSDSNGCVNSADKDVITAVADVNNENGVATYPNPSSGNVTVELLNFSTADEVTIEVMNTLGQKILSSVENISTPNWKKEIQLSDASPGVYFIELKSENIFFREKIIITN